MLDELHRLDVEDAAATWSRKDADVATVPPARLQPEHDGTEMPGWIWRGMIAAYGVFFSGLFAAVGRDREAVFMLVVSIGFAVMYFGTARALLNVKPAAKPSLFERGLGPLKTWTGPMSASAVAGQVLAVPFCLAAFGLAIAVISRIAL